MVLDENGHEVRLWGNDPQQIKEINEQHTNEHYLPGAKLSESIVAYTDLKAAIGDADALLFGRWGEIFADDIVAAAMIDVAVTTARRRASTWRRS